MYHGRAEWLRNAHTSPLWWPDSFPAAGVVRLCSVNHARVSSSFRTTCLFCLRSSPPFFYTFFLGTAEMGSKAAACAQQTLGVATCAAQVVFHGWEPKTHRRNLKETLRSPEVTSWLVAEQNPHLCNAKYGKWCESIAELRFSAS